MKKRFNLTRYGHGTYPHNKSHFDLYETLESILKSNKSKKTMNTMATYVTTLS